MTFGYCVVRDRSDSVLAVLRDEEVIVLRELIPEAPDDFAALLDDWDGVTDHVEAALGNAEASDRHGRPSQDVSFGIPTVERPVVYCADANYSDHVTEMGAVVVDLPFHFISPALTLNAAGAAVRRPVHARKLDWEVELAAVIGRPARHVSRSNALIHVAGYTVANDVSVRDDYIFHPIFGLDWMSAKNAEGLTPIGPAVVPSRFISDPGQLELTLSVNGEVRQQSNTNLMIVDLACQIESLSSRITLQPGDLVLTETPAGTAAAYGRYLEDGDRMVAAIEGIGALENVVAG